MDRISALLVVNDSTQGNSLAGVLQANANLQIVSCSSANDAIAVLNQGAFQIIYLDLMPDDMPGVAFVEKVKQTFPYLHIIVDSSKGTARDVVSAIQAGATDFVVDPNETDLVLTAFEKAVAEIVKRQASTSISRSTPKPFITQDKSLQQVLGIAKKVAPSTANILITGESGTGKELLASFIHYHSNRKNGPYVAINCAALPEQLAESELFGHEKGAFTGAIARKIGKFEGGQNGSLILDEITEMDLSLQAKLLRALQEREIVRLGSNRPVPIDTRVIAISNRSMKQAVNAGIFREDLFYRLNVIPLTIPPLRERKNDIPLLADYFLKRFSNQHSTSMSRISDEVMELLTRQAWPGNVRELENTIQRGVLIGSGEALLAAHLILEEPVSAPSGKPQLPPGMTVREMEKELIFNTLSEVNDNRTHAAKMLGISIRTLRNKLNEYRDETGMPIP